MTRLRLPCVPRPGPIPWSMLATCLLLSATSASASAANQPAAPTIESETVSNIEPGTSGATLEAQIATNGLQTEYQLWIKCGSGGFFECTSAELVASGTIPAGTPSQDVSVNVDGLSQGNDDQYWVLATNPDGTTTGETMIFSPEIAWPGPTSATEAATVSGEHEATLNGLIYPNAREPGEFTYFFEYGPTTSYGASAPAQPGATIMFGGCGEICAGEATQPKPVSMKVAGLAAATTYHYRFVTTSAHGYRQFGPDATFTTPAAPPIEVVETPSGGSGQANTSTLVAVTPPFTPPSTQAPTLAAVHPPPRSKAAKLLAHAVSMCHRRRTHRLACLQRAYQRYGRAARRDRK